MLCLTEFTFVLVEGVMIFFLGNATGVPKGRYSEGDICVSKSVQTSLLANIALLGDCLC